MARPNPIRKIMSQPLPMISEQRRKCFRPTNKEVIYAYNILNKYLFDNTLYRPNIELGRLRKTWGYCLWQKEQQDTGSYCTIKLSDKWFSPQWCVNVLAHEMVHQYQWDLHRWQHREEFGREINLNSAAHGPSFFAWRGFMSDFGLDLKTSHGMKRWFKHQDLSRC